MTCNPGEGWGKDGDTSEYSNEIVVEPEWTCPRSDMTYSRQYNQVWPNSIFSYIPI
jgi:hypothetical protein